MIEAVGLDALIADLTAAPQEVQRRAAGSIERAATGVRDDARMFSSGLAHAPRYPRSITHEVIFELATGTLRGVIGPDKDLPQGALGNLLEFGSAKNAPLAHLGPALDRHGPQFADDLADDAAAALW